MYCTLHTEIKASTSNVIYTKLNFPVFRLDESSVILLLRRRLFYNEIFITFVGDFRRVKIKARAIL